MLSQCHKFKAANLRQRQFAHTRGHLRVLFIQLFNGGSKNHSLPKGGTKAGSSPAAPSKKQLH